jgi:hypothetical protein
MFNLKNMAKGAAISAVALSLVATSAMADKVLRFSLFWVTMQTKFSC